MSTQVEMLTPSEVAVIAGVSLRDVHRIIDEHILPESFYGTTQARSFKRQACVFICFYFGSADRLTSEERQRTITLASEPSFDWKTPKNLVQNDFLTIDFAPFRQAVDERLKRLHAARQIVVSDPDILSGTPVFKGTRVPVYDIAASVSAGLSTDRILVAYPSLTRDQVELASLFAEANPQRGRPRHRTSLPAGAKVISTKRKSLRTSA